jgi:phosphoribosylamine-glycine ligase
VAIDADSTNDLIEFAKANQVGLTIIDPAAPLVNGIVCLKQTRKLLCALSASLRSLRYSPPTRSIASS